MLVWPDGHRRQPISVRSAMRIPLLVALTSIGLIGPAQARKPLCTFESRQVTETYFAVRHAAWTQCDCTHAQSARSFRRCYREAVRQRGMDQGLPEGCIRLLSTGVGVRSTCGRPKAVVCCTAKPDPGGCDPGFDVAGVCYALSCSVKASAKRCVAPRSGRVCINTGQQDCDTGEGADSNCGCIDQQIAK